MLMKLRNWTRGRSESAEEISSDSAAPSVLDRSASEVAIIAEATDPPLDNEQAIEMLSRWLGLSRTQRRALSAWTEELDVVDSHVERSIDELSSSFRVMAETALAQSRQADALVAACQTLNLGDREVSMAEAAQIIDDYLTGMVNRIVQISTQGISIVFALDDVVRDLESIEELIADVDEINKQTNLLAINAMIEAARAGKAGQGFSIVAHEVRNLSKSVKQLADRMNSQVDVVATGIRKGHERLHEIAKIDMTDNVVMKDRLCDMMNELMRNNEAFSTTLSESGLLSRTFADKISNLVTTMQVQEPTSQRLEHIKATFAAMDLALEAMHAETQDAGLGRQQRPRVDEAWLRQVIADRIHGELGERFVKSVLMDGQSTEIENPNASGDDNDKVS